MMATPEARKPKRRWLWRGLIVLVILLAAGELFARFYLGLGDPVLYRADPQIEYLELPSHIYHRLGHIISYNSHSMRADEFGVHKSDPRELRVMVLGDSVVNGGSRLDQSEIASELLKSALRARLTRPVVVGNIAANSWGPPNVLAYVKQFGLFDADVVVMVLNSEDDHDVPTFAPLSSDYPVRKPICALQELVSMAWKKLCEKLSPPPQHNGAAQSSDTDVAVSLKALSELVQAAQQSGAKVIVVQHSKLSEIGKSPPRGQVAIARAVQELGLAPIDAAPAFVRAAGDHGRVADLYFDDIHPDAAGQKVLADVLTDAVMHAANAAP